ncbi:ras-induced vulval development antagonist-domain-containing protein [Suillus paluster]|uniref:ras-induced vulval development antagonist-domain-containing protein n=1 Tax=Suillus paluster TaxID=48578 RepID=UPI001B861251|nr:ras-induced vulval development antagonist-domain-containing protein [Suillus paluster]KAG1751358.1 ras-induced vulval development antagonist-domain-containing protein [Suillus paluster]
MATVHPSRMGLVPQDPKDINLSRRRARSPSPRAQHPTTTQLNEKEKETTAGTEHGTVAENKRGTGGGMIRDRSADRGRERDRDRSRERRRASPEYTDYRRPATPLAAEAPWRNQENVYPNRQGRDRPPHAGGSYGGGGSEYLESRRVQREASTISVWPSSPKAPTRTLSPSRDSKARGKSKRDRSETPTDDSDSDEERKRKERKERKRARKEKDRAERREKKEKKSRAPSRRRSYDSEEEHREKSRQSESKSHPRSPSPSRTPSPARASEEDEWVEKPTTAPFASSSTAAPSRHMPNKRRTRTLMMMMTDDDDDVGPQPLYKAITKKFDERAYGSALLRGEGSAMAAFLQDDTDSRIPRRGEIGLTSDEIATFESVGYVMSGSRHKRMNAVRMRKENQVISAEEKRGILKLQKDERQRREAILREEFSELVTEKLKGPQTQPK